jgi:hypothetical protein
MSRVQPQPLTDEELLRQIYMVNYTVSAEVVQELYNRFAALLDATYATWLLDATKDDNK